MQRGRIENLKPFTSEQDREAARRNGRKGGLVWGRMRRERRQRKAEETAKRLLRPWELWFEKSTVGLQLNPRQYRFLWAFASCGNASQAAREAGYSIRWAKNIGYRLLRRQDVREGLRCINLRVRCESDPEKWKNRNYWGD